MTKSLVIASIRILAVLLGLLLLLIDVSNLLLLTPESELPAPSLASRAFMAVPSILVAALLLLPYRKFSRTPAGFFVFVGLLAAFLAGAYVAAGWILGFAAGKKSWEVVPMAAFVVSFLAAHLWAAFELLMRAPRELSP